MTNIKNHGNTITAKSQSSSNLNQVTYSSFINLTGGGTTLYCPYVNHAKIFLMRSLNLINWLPGDKNLHMVVSAGNHTVENAYIEMKEKFRVGADNQDLDMYTSALHFISCFIPKGTSISGDVDIKSAINSMNKISPIHFDQECTIAEEILRTPPYQLCYVSLRVNFLILAPIVFN